MSLVDSLEEIRESEKHLSAMRVSAKYNALVARGLIKEEERKVPSPGEVNSPCIYLNQVIL